MRYFAFNNKTLGTRFFAVEEYDYVIQIIVKIYPKKGRHYVKGITQIKYNTWSSNYGYHLTEKGKEFHDFYGTPNPMKEISRDDFKLVYNTMKDYLDLQIDN